MKKRIIEECFECGGTGLYSGMCEQAGEAVACIRCDGQGWRIHEYSTFVGRKKRRGIKMVRFSRGRCIADGVGGTGEPMSYAEFEKRVKAKKPPEER
jgi:hypothetical protein